VIMVSRGRLTAVWRRLAASEGYSLSEMIVVLAILLVVVTALTQLFVSGSNAEAEMSKRVRAQQDARLALDTFRREIHCASSVTNTPPPSPPALTTPTSSITIALGSYCPTNTTGAPTTVTWCTVGSSAPFTLWRDNGSTCLGTGRKWASYLTTKQVFTAYSGVATSSTPWAASTAYTAGQLVRPTNTATAPYLFRVTAAGTNGTTEPTWPTTLNATVTNGGVTFQNIGTIDFSLGKLSVNLPVDLTPGDMKQRYTLTDDIVLRNTPRV
jgi:prepilin-type N-terminal cleavage/methylation domain-containing protein